MAYDLGNLSNVTNYLSNYQGYKPTNGSMGMPSAGWDGWNNYSGVTNYAGQATPGSSNPGIDANPNPSVIASGGTGGGSYNPSPLSITNTTPIAPNTQFPPIRTGGGLMGGGPGGQRPPQFMGGGPHGNFNRQQHLNSPRPMGMNNGNNTGTLASTVSNLPSSPTSGGSWSYQNGQWNPLQGTPSSGYNPNYTPPSSSSMNDWMNGTGVLGAAHTSLGGLNSLENASFKNTGSYLNMNDYAKYGDQLQNGGMSLQQLMSQLGWS